MVQIGNPAPLGLFAFSITTAMLMCVDMGWVEKDFEQFVSGYALYYGGLCQLLVGIFDLFKGKSFSFAVFGTYGAFWLGWGLMVLETHRTDTTLVMTSMYPEGKAAYLAIFGMITFNFWIIALRKNLCLISTLGLLWLTFFVLAAGAATGDLTVKKAGGYIGLLTAISAWYTGMAELINEDVGRPLCPGLAPILNQSRAPKHSSQHVVPLPVEKDSPV